jgi:hypothetical protein
MKVESRLIATVCEGVHRAGELARLMSVPWDPIMPPGAIGDANTVVAELRGTRAQLRAIKSARRAQSRKPKRGTYRRGTRSSADGTADT